MLDDKKKFLYFSSAWGRFVGEKKSKQEYSTKSITGLLTKWKQSHKRLGTRYNAIIDTMWGPLKVVRDKVTMLVLKKNVSIYLVILILTFVLQNKYKG